MMWFVASLPFWIVGALLALTGMFGILTIGRRNVSVAENQHVIIGSIAFLILAGLMLLVAAKVAS